MFAHKIKLTSLTLAIFIAGCANTQTNQLVESQNQAYFSSQAYVNELAQTQQSDWWVGYNNPQLNQLIEQALAQNHSLRSAALKYKASLQQLGYEEAQYYPQGSIDAQLQRQSINKDITNQATAGANLYWQLDLFGRISALVDAAQAQTFQAQESRIKLASEIVSGLTRSFFEWQGNQLKLELVNRQINALVESLDVLQARVDEGFASTLDLDRTLVQLNQQQALIPEISRRLYQNQATIAVLVGLPAEEVKLKFEDPAINTALAAPLNLYQPENAVKLRPEINIALYTLAEQSALDQAAQAALYPDISLTGFAGLLNPNGSNLSSDDKSWRVTPGISWSILSYPALKAQANAQNSLTEAMLAEYENTLVNIISESQTAVKNTYFSEQINNYSQQSLKHALLALEQAEALYEEGSVPYLDLLSARQVALETEQAALDSKINLLQSRISTYQAFSGGWSRQLINQKQG